MTDWQNVLNDDPIPWLLEPDPENPSVCYFALRELLARPEGAPEVQAARAAIMTTGPVPAILDAQYPDGYWVKPGGGYSPKYRGTVWQIIFLAELGADPSDERVRRGCEYLLSQWLHTLLERQPAVRSAVPGLRRRCSRASGSGMAGAGRHRRGGIPLPQVGHLRAMLCL